MKTLAEMVSEQRYTVAASVAFIGVCLLAVMIAYVILPRLNSGDRVRAATPTDERVLFGTNIAVPANPAAQKQYAGQLSSSAPASSAPETPIAVPPAARISVDGSAYTMMERQAGTIKQKTFVNR